MLLLLCPEVFLACIYCICSLKSATRFNGFVLHLKMVYNVSITDDLEEKHCIELKYQVKRSLLNGRKDVAFGIMCS